ncbi:WD40 repeat domain-containing protein [Vermiphilus pyriformis]|nr:MAG: WD40 repeat domain-containing protein [Vermiphilus pyriformis]
MKLKFLFVLVLTYTLSAYSADLVKQEVSTTITAEGKYFLGQDVYNKLLAISGTLQSDYQEHYDANPVYFPNIQKPYYEIAHDTQYLQHIIDYISSDNTHAYLNTLSLVQLIHLYQNAGYWSLVTPILDNLRIYIATKLQNKDVLATLLSTQENLDTFLKICNPQTKLILTYILLPYVCDLFWPKATKSYQTLKGHTRELCSTIVYLDETLFSGSVPGNVRVWKKDVQGAYDCIQTFTTNNFLYSLALCADGTLFTGLVDRTIRVWKKDAQGTYRCVQTLAGHTSDINTVAVHPDSTLFSGSDDGTIRVWKKDTQGIYHCVQTLTGHTHCIRTVAVHADGTLFSCSWDKIIRVWKQDAQGIYHCVQTLIGHTGFVYSVAVHTDGTLFSGSDDDTIRVWKKDTQGIYHCVQTLTGHTTWISSVVVHTNGTLFSGSRDSTVRVWKPDAQGTYHCVQILQGHTDWIKTVVVHTDGTLLSASDDRTIRVWKKDTQGIYYFTEILENHTVLIPSMTKNTVGSLFSTFDDHTISVWKMPVVTLLSLEQCMTVIHLYHQYWNNKQQLPTLSNHIQAIYSALPDSVKDGITTWYKSNTTLDAVVPERVSQYSYKKFFVAGLVASIIGAGCYLYYKWLRK